MKKKGLVNKIFLENRTLIEEDMKKNHLTYKQAIVNLTSILSNLNKNGYIEKDKEISEHLSVKLGYYEFSGNTLIPTTKGKETYAEFIRLNYKK